jgi:hypothetical protein
LDPPLATGKEKFWDALEHEQMLSLAGDPLFFSNAGSVVVIDWQSR